MPDSYLGASAAAKPAPPKYITVPKTIVVHSTRTVASPSSGQSSVAATPVQQLYSSGGYIYKSNGNGGYTNAGSAYPGMTPSQVDAMMAAPALASQPNGAAGMGSAHPNVSASGSLV